MFCNISIVRQGFLPHNAYILWLFVGWEKVVPLYGRVFSIGNNDSNKQEVFLGH
jgi:hypothetical protein